MDKIRLREQLESLRGENFAIRWYGSRGISNDFDGSCLNEIEHSNIETIVIWEN